jgi:LmbE family N-acetylglucosaminyl deacetylase
MDTTQMLHTAPITPITPIAPLPTRLVGVWAHPDDECYLSAGLMARVVAAGGHVRLVCATRGEFGTSDPSEAGSEHFGRRRHDELLASLEVLGVDDVQLLDLPDGGCRDADPAAMARIIADHIDDVGADTVVTFGPDGITAHPDHVAVSLWTTAATRATAVPAVELLYATMTHDFADRHRAMHDRIGLFADCPDGQPYSVGRDRLALQVALDDTELIRKRRALGAHHSQTAPLAAMVGEEVFVSWWRDESFRRPTEVEIASAVAVAGPRTVGATT